MKRAVAKVKPSASLQVYKLKDVAGRYIHDTSGKDDIENQIYLELWDLLESLLIGGRLFIDFEGVDLLDPILVENIVNKFKAETGPRGRGLLRGRFLIIKDANEGIKRILESYLRMIHGSAIVVRSDPNDPLKTVIDEPLNLPPFLREVFEIINERGPITSGEVADLLGEKGLSARERLRRLHKRGFVRRRAEGSLEGDRYFIYEEINLYLK